MSAFRFLLLSLVVVVRCARGDILYSVDQNIEGFGEVDALIFSDAFTVAEPWILDAVSLDVTHNYAAELEFSLTSPTAEVSYLLQRNGIRTRLGDGSGTLAGVETYTLVDSGASMGSVTEWGTPYNFIIPGGTYDALEWPDGTQAEGSWTIALRNVNVSGLEGGALGSVTVYGHVIPEPRTSMVGLIGVWILLSWRRRQTACPTSRCRQLATAVAV